jgi:hypothetical protein
VSCVWFVRSTDGGKTWSEVAQKVNPEVGRTDQFNQKLAESGILGIIYYNTGTGSDRKKTNVTCQFATDSGKTWSQPPTRVTTAITDETTVEADNGNQFRDYNGLSFVKGIYFPSWTDPRDNASESIFTAMITLKQSAAGAFEPAVVAGAGGIETQPPNR